MAADITVADITAAAFTAADFTAAAFTAAAFTVAAFTVAAFTVAAFTVAAFTAADSAVTVFTAAGGRASIFRDPPYFALYPPVYYSQPIPRPYGFSPYAYPPGTMTPEAIRVQPLMVTNPFVPQLAAAERPTTTTGPLRIRNPYVAQPETGLAAFNGLTDLPASKPQIVYPANLK